MNVRPYSEYLCQMIKGKAEILNLDYGFLFSVIQSLAFEQINGKSSNPETRLNKIMIDYCLVTGFREEELLTEISPEISSLQYTMIAQNNDFAGEALSYMSVNGPIKQYHLTAFNKAMAYIKTLNDGCSVYEVIQNIQSSCKQEIDKVLIEIEAMNE